MMSSYSKFGRCLPTGTAQVDTERGLRRQPSLNSKRQACAPPPPRRLAGRGPGFLPMITHRGRAAFSCPGGLFSPTSTWPHASRGALFIRFARRLQPASDATRDGSQLLHRHNYGASDAKRVGEACRDRGEV
jgi:hypothetical protein